jgi:exoribonuclease R
LDTEVAERANSVYMNNIVYHMLPEQLISICSLVPGKNKLAFSFILEMTPEAEIVNYRFSKTVVNSCCRIFYEQAEAMIDDNAYNWEKNDSIQIYGNYHYSILYKNIQDLYKLSVKLKKNRMNAGTLENVKSNICF